MGGDDAAVVAADASRARASRAKEGGSMGSARVGGPRGWKEGRGWKERGCERMMEGARLRDMGLPAVCR
jgi:hypothetical protein